MFSKATLVKYLHICCPLAVDITHNRERKAPNPLIHWTAARLLLQQRKKGSLQHNECCLTHLYFFLSSSLFHLFFCSFIYSFLFWTFNISIYLLFPWSTYCSLYLEIRVPAPVFSPQVQPIFFVSLPILRVSTINFSHLYCLSIFIKQLLFSTPRLPTLSASVSSFSIAIYLCRHDFHLFLLVTPQGKDVLLFNPVVGMRRN